VARTLPGLLLCGLLVFGTPEIVEAEWHFTPLGGLTFLGDTSIAEPELGATGKIHWNFGGAVTLLGAGSIGLEGLAVYTSGFFDREDASPSLVTSSHAFALMGNVVVAAPRAWNAEGLRPFLSGGVGLHRASVSDVFNALPVTENLLGFNVGGGATGFITERTGLRFDLRHFSTLRRPDQNISFGRVRLSYWTGSVGVVFRY
jgi:hypothetical protein